MKRGGEDPDTLRGRRARPSPSRLTCAGSASAHSPSRFAGPPGTCAATLPSRGCRAEQAEGRPERAVAPMELEGAGARGSLYSPAYKVSNQCAPPVLTVTILSTTSILCVTRRSYHSEQKVE